MLKITIKGPEFYDEEKQEFTYGKDTTLTLEHSLVSISKWEAKYHKPFMKEKEKMTSEETIEYIKFMTLTQNVDPEVYNRINNNVIKQIADYIKDPMTATWFSNTKKRGGTKRIITSELLYYQMVAYNIPFECQKWHLNRLLTLIRVCEEESQPKKKKSQREALMEQAAINKARRAKKKGGRP